MQVSPNITLEWLYDGQVAAFTLTGVSLDVIENFGNAIHRVLEEWPNDLPILMLYDLSTPGVGLPYLTLNEQNLRDIGITPTGHEKIEELHQVNPARPIRLAVIISESASGKIVQKHDRTPMETWLETHVFFSRERALAWLMN